MSADRPRERRMVVAIDASPASEGLVAAASVLAAAAGARLTGLYVVDSVLLEIAGSGLGREVGSFSGLVRALGPRQMERRMELWAAEMQRRLAEVAEAAGVRWSFRVRHGRVAHELLAAAREGDLLILGCGRSRRRLGGSLLRLLDEAQGSLLVLGHGHEVGRRLVVVHEDSEAGEQTVVAAAELGAGIGGVLEVLLAAGDPKLEERLRRLTDRHRIEVRLRRLPQLDAETVVRALSGSSGDLLVVPPGGALGREDALLAVFDHAGCPVLLYRPGGEPDQDTASTAEPEPDS